MKLTIERSDLLNALSHVQNVVERRNTIPILANLLLKASDNGKLAVSGTDLDVAITSQVDMAADTLPAEGITLPGALLVDIIDIKIQPERIVFDVLRPPCNMGQMQMQPPAIFEVVQP